MAVYLVCDHLLAYTGLAGNKHGGIGSRYMPDFLPDTIQRLECPIMGRASRVPLFSLTEDTGSRFLISSRLWRNCSKSPLQQPSGVDRDGR